MRKEFEDSRKKLCSDGEIIFLSEPAALGRSLYAWELRGKLHLPDNCWHWHTYTHLHCLSSLAYIVHTHIWILHIYRANHHRHTNTHIQTNIIDIHTRINIASNHHWQTDTMCITVTHINTAHHHAFTPLAWFANITRFYVLLQTSLLHKKNASSKTDVLKICQRALFKSYELFEIIINSDFRNYLRYVTFLIFGNIWTSLIFFSQMYVNKQIMLIKKRDKSCLRIFIKNYERLNFKIWEL